MTLIVVVCRKCGRTWNVVTGIKRDYRNYECGKGEGCKKAAC